MANIIEAEESDGDDLTVAAIKVFILPSSGESESLHLFLNGSKKGDEKMSLNFTPSAEVFFIISINVCVTHVPNIRAEQLV